VEGEPRGGEGTRPHPFTPLIHISGYAYARLARSRANTAGFSLCGDPW